MNELTTSLKVVLSNTFVMYFKTHSFHWNVEGQNFKEYHEFFEDLYADLFSATDVLAEQMRALNMYAPMNLGEMYVDSTLSENTTLVGTQTQQMFSQLYIDNNEVIDSLNVLFTNATNANQQGLVNVVADRIDKHRKHGWMLSAFTKT